MVEAGGKDELEQYRGSASDLHRVRIASDPKMEALAKRLSQTAIEITYIVFRLDHA